MAALTGKAPAPLPGAPPADLAPSGPWDRGAALAIALFSLVVVAVVLPVAGQPWPAVPAFIPAYQSAVAVNDLVTAALLFGLFRELRRPSLLVLAAAYLVTAPLVVAHALSFPNLFVPGSLIGGPQTTVWLWLAWHVTLPLATIAYAARTGRPGDIVEAGAGANRALAGAIVIALALAGLLVAWATAGHGLLPPLLDGVRYLPGVTRPALALPMVLALVALGLLVLRTRLRSALDMWLAVAMGAWAVEVLLSAVANSGRFQAGFYVGRLYGLLASCTLLVSLLLATLALHGRLARSLARERDLALSQRNATEAELAASENELRRLNQDLEARVRDEVAAREAAQARLAHAQRMEALGQLAGGIAHDFNNVMQAVLGGAGLIRRRSSDPQAVDHLARMVEGAAQRGASVTRRLLSFARRGELHAEPVDPAALLGGIEEILAHTLDARITIRTEVVTQPGRALAPLLADKGQLETVLVNLAANARDAMPGGGVLTLTAGEETVEAGGAVRRDGPASGRYVRLAMSDTGEGMAPDVLARASEPFFTTKATGKGTGLGLAMARGFAEQSGGAFAIRSMVGVGTTVTLWLPVALDPVAAGMRHGPAAAAATSAPPRAARVLVVDDEELVREVLATGLEERGCTALRAPGADAALAMLAAGAEVDVLLTDYAMPGMDGLALVAEARRQRPGLPAVLLTGNVNGQVEARLALEGVAGGAFSLLRKPVGAEQLADRILALLDRQDAT